MAKWIFVTFIAALTVAALGAVLDSDLGLVARSFSLACAGTFASALVAVWLGAYYPRFKAAGCLVLGHAGVLLAAGIGFIGLGVHGLDTGSCSHLESSTSKTGALARLAMWAAQEDACSLLSLGLVSFGLFMLWPSF